MIRAVLFDFDGTLTHPGAIDFDVIRGAIGCPGGRPVLEFIADLPSPTEREKATRILNEFEAEAARQSQPNEGAEETLEFMRARGLKLGIISRNSRASIETALKNFKRIQASDFSVILSRDDPFHPKPDPEGVLAAAAALGVPIEQSLVVGDFIFDIEAGDRAGSLTAFLTNRSSPHAGVCTPDFMLQNLRELMEIIRLYAALPAGKLPNDLLRQFLPAPDATARLLLVAPGVGEDTAAVQLAGEEVLVLKSDPVTFATDAIGFYAVAVNVNDIATSGATPRWLLASMLFPTGTNAIQVRDALVELQQAALRQDLILCGGHTEITDAVTRPVVAAQVAGTVARRDLIDKKNMAEGHRVLLTKGLAIEATSIIAREIPDRLRELGMEAAEIERCRNFLVDPGISVLKEARLAARTGKVSAMHDVTEGGLSTALAELSIAGNHRIRVYPDRIPIYQETNRLCRLLGLSPLGLIGSGCLLITCASAAADDLIAACRAAGIDAACVGEVLGCGCGIEAVDADGRPTDWPQFAVDEIARLFSGLRKET